MNFITKLPRAILPVFLFLLSYGACAQGYYGLGPVKWENNAPFKVPAEADKYASADLIVLNEVTEFYFYTGKNEKIIRTLRFKINTENGAKLMKQFRTPESFDFALDQHLNQRGQEAKIKIPYVNDYNLVTFTARKFSHNHWAKVSVKDYYEQVRWIKQDGEFRDEENILIKLGQLVVGDVLEIYYEASFNAAYGSNLFYFNGPYPKLYCEFSFIYENRKDFEKTAFVLPIHIEGDKVKHLRSSNTQNELITERFIYNNLNEVSYPLNSFWAGKLPHVYADFKHYRALKDLTPEIVQAQSMNGHKNFEWAVRADTLVHSNTKIYDKELASMSKFLSVFPACGSEAQNLTFFKNLCDTFNNFRFISANHFFYHESELYRLNNGDHVLKRRLPGNQRWKLYTDILRNNKIFYYVVSAQDKRLGEHNAKTRVHTHYEHKFLALPLKDSCVYFMARMNGVKYYVNELPFYIEGATVALMPTNFQSTTLDKAHKGFRLVKTPASSYLNNTRSEKATVKVNLDSLSANFTISEELSGQFSTVLRHFYMNQSCDSTIAPHYFKKCVSKPGAFSQKCSLIHSDKNFPFTTTFNCGLKLKLKEAVNLSLKNWFSFVINKTSIPKEPVLDYYFDFDFSDSYSFLIGFGKPVEVKNRDAFTKHINNQFFELDSEILKKSDGLYEVNVRLLAKQKSIPANQSDLLMSLLNELEQLNNFVMELN